MTYLIFKTEQVNTFSHRTTTPVTTVIKPSKEVVTEQAYDASDDPSRSPSGAKNHDLSAENAITAVIELSRTLFNQVMINK
ncbi:MULTISPECIES: hypothetical protein [unclassified Shewanella]|uniref:hypothetical protein n=2 Tax=Shewanella TaxID=22 RepID=UPI000C86372F|nr:MULTISPECIES: hypothetical protein [unclassified Shewanella]MDO6618833.1 hypothetical protein [Shewanella sp. 6_MG-2023]MDO6640386.1 hypothetical protein [Shewanella sp. 5_MG-2023]MDO6677848.1 hypothetical protein [Shewanella sp. 4_MG-2023]MDO6775225.1 hypothetical protein [Shewanella sp. 3_MG-2023]PMG29689.1 hypothetical protein BCU94_02735 [Shewanella sp. 10N.286.52.C2]